jgi:hypothetical protein
MAKTWSARGRNRPRLRSRTSSGVLSTRPLPSARGGDMLPYRPLRGVDRAARDPRRRALQSACGCSARLASGPEQPDRHQQYQARRAATTSSPTRIRPSQWTTHGHCRSTPDAATNIARNTASDAVKCCSACSRNAVPGLVARAATTGVARTKTSARPVADSAIGRRSARYVLYPRAESPHEPSRFNHLGTHAGWDAAHRRRLCFRSHTSSGSGNAVGR